MKSKHDEILQNLSKWHKEKAKGQQAEKLFLGSLRASRAIKNPFLTNSIVDRIEIQAEITSFNMRYYMNLTKLRLRSQLATITKQVAHGWGCGGILGCGVAGAATQNR